MITLSRLLFGVVGEREQKVGPGGEGKGGGTYFIYITQHILEIDNFHMTKILQYVHTTYLPICMYVCTYVRMYVLGGGIETRMRLTLRPYPAPRET